MQVLRKAISTLFIILVVLQRIASAETLPEDSQVWTETWIYAPENIADYDLGYINTTRLAGDNFNILDERHSAFLTFIYSKEFNITLQSLYLEQHPTAVITNKQYRQLMDLHGKFTFNDLRITYRARAERQFRESADDRWNFRPRIGVEVPINETTYLFANTEGFYNSEGRLWFRSRNLAGIGFNVGDYVTAEAYIGNQIERNTAGNDFNTTGVIMKVRF